MLRDPDHWKRLPAGLLSALISSSQMCSHTGGSGSWKRCGIAASETCNPELPRSAAQDSNLSTWQILQETPLHKTSAGVDVFSLIFSYLCLCCSHGKLVLLKHIKTYPKDSVSGNSAQYQDKHWCRYQAVPVRFYLLFSVWYVLPCPAVAVLFGQTRINKE